MNLDRKLLIVIDPTLDSQPAVERVVNLITEGPAEYQPSITLLVTTDCSIHHTDKPGSYWTMAQVDAVSERLVAAGHTPEVLISWSTDWADNILYTAETVEATAIMLSHPGAEKVKAMTDEFWHLVRNTSVPIAIHQSHQQPKFSTVLASVNLQDDSEQREELNRRVVRAGMAIAKIYGAQLHLANAYGTSSEYPNRGKLVASTGLPNDNIHLVAGEPEEGIAEIVNTLDPDALIIGATHRRGIKAALRGRKMSRIFRAVDKDIYIIV